MLKTISIIVSGKVQGVFYRQSAKEIALDIGITGQAANHPDGTVHITATGTEQQLAAFCTWCSAGPPRAHVTSVDRKEIPLQIFIAFTIQRL